MEFLIIPKVGVNIFMNKTPSMLWNSWFGFCLNYLGYITVNNIILLFTVGYMRYDMDYINVLQDRCLGVGRNFVIQWGVYCLRNQKYF